MFDRFTDRARKVMGLARQEAQRFHHGSIGTEHVLLGLLREGTGVGVAALRRRAVDPEEVRRQVEGRLRPGDASGAEGMLPFTPRARKVLELTLEEASDLGHTYIGTEHLLLGLLREDEGIAAKVLRGLGLRIADLRREVLAVTGDDEARGEDDPDPGPSASPPDLRVSRADRRRDTRSTEARMILTVLRDLLPGTSVLRVLSEELRRSEVGLLDALDGALARLGGEPPPPDPPPPER